MGGTQSPDRWPEHLPVGALRVVRWSPHYERTVGFYRDLVGLRVLETFEESYGHDGTILGMPGSPVHLEIVRAESTSAIGDEPDQLVFYLPDVAAQQRIVARLAVAGIRPVRQLAYWEDNGGVTYRDPDGHQVVFASWVYKQPTDGTATAGGDPS